MARAHSIIGPARAAGEGCADGYHDWTRERRRDKRGRGKFAAAQCRECGALRCQNFPNSGEHLYAPRCWQAGSLDAGSGMVYCADCLRRPTIDPDFYRLPAAAYAA